jgi:2,4-dienoyl-CoA reductase-like NADH-dependent reductase (Old Yellow Enzyme family)/aryl-alcohol dehydrogenase-like predicted oxidoreductase
MALPRTPLLRRFGGSGLTFPEIGLGTWTLSGRSFGPVDDLESSRVVCQAVQLGLRFVDTADIYGNGHVERRLGEWLKTEPSVFVSTKVGNEPRESGSSRKNFDSSYIASAVSGCQARLKRARLDLLHLHNPPATALQAPDLVGLLDDLKRNGHVRLLGLSTVERDEIVRLREWAIFDAVQIPFNILRQDLFLACRSALERWRGAIIVRTPLEYGMLGGALAAAETLAADDYRRRAWSNEEEHRKRAAATELSHLFSRRGIRTLPQAALQVALLPDIVSVVIPGCRSTQQLISNVTASRDIPPLSRFELHEMDRILRANGLESALASEISGPPRVAVRATRAQTERPPSAHLLARPLRIGSHLLANRFVRSGTTERAGDPEGLPTDAMTKIHVALAQGGAAMIVTGYLAVETAGRASQSHCILCPGPAVEAWRRITCACKSVADVKICAQLGHGGALALAPYDRAGITRTFVSAARAAADAGFDAVQLHAAHGYFLGQLLAQRPPLRDGIVDHPGLKEFRAIVTAVADEVRPSLAVLIKANSSDFVPGGYDVADADAFADQLATMPVDAVEWSGWTPAACSWDTPSRLGEVEERSEGFFVPFAARVKARHPQLIVGSCGGFRSRIGMIEAVSRHGLDFISLARPLIAEPDLPRRIFEGQARAFCDGCNECLAKAVRPVHCPRLTQAVDSDVGEQSCAIT